jgi:uncharacterized membrane protein required for colicin V production
MALLAIMLIFLIVSAKRGFLITLLEVLVFAIAVISAANLCKPAANSIYDTNITEKVSASLSENSDIMSSAGKASAVVDNLPKIIKDYILRTDPDENNITSEILNGDFSGTDAAEKLSSDIAKPIAVTVLSPVIFLLLSIVLSLLLSVVAKWLNKICKLPLIGTANTVLGGVFGILKGLIAVYFIGIILLLLSANSKQNTSFYEAVNNSAIITIIQNHSIVPIG